MRKRDIYDTDDMRKEMRCALWCVWMCVIAVDAWADEAIQPVTAHDYMALPTERAAPVAALQFALPVRRTAQFMPLGPRGMRPPIRIKSDEVASSPSLPPISAASPVAFHAETGLPLRAEAKQKLTGEMAQQIIYLYGAGR